MFYVLCPIRNFARFGIGHPIWNEITSASRSESGTRSGTKSSRRPIWNLHSNPNSNLIFILLYLSVKLTLDSLTIQCTLDSNNNCLYYSKINKRNYLQFSKKVTKLWNMHAKILCGENWEIIIINFY